MQSSRTQCDFRKATSILERKREKNLACIASVSVRTKSSLPGGRVKIVREKFFFLRSWGGGGGGEGASEGMLASKPNISKNPFAHERDS